MSGVRILVVDDEPDVLETCRRILSSLSVGGIPFRVESESSGARALERLQAEPFDILLADLRLADGDPAGLELVRAARERRDETLCVIMTGFPSVDSAVEALRLGAGDYLVKPFSAEQLELALVRIAELCLLRRENRSLRARVDQAEGPVEVLGQSPAIRATLDLAARVAPSEASMFLTGESGTGKSLLARWIHARSERKEGPFISLSCAAIPETLLESELFGHERGAFTGAVATRQGMAELADGGSLFLDDVCDMPVLLQSKLLEFLQERTFRHVGGNRRLRADVRIISATSRSADEALRSGRLREDLYYRLSVVVVRIPPLRERPEDILPLARHFAIRHGARRGWRDPKFDEQAQAALLRYPWPGNVRELQNAIEHACAVAEPGATCVQVDDLPSHLAEHLDPRVLPVESFRGARQAVLEQFERDYFQKLLAESGGNISEAARRAGVSRNTVYRYAAVHGIPVAESP